MRLAATTVALAASLPALVSADSTTASGAMGVGAFDDQPATTVEAGVDFAGDSWAVGLGARLRILASDGVRREEWDEASEIGRVLRYAVFRRESEAEEWGVAAAAGELGGVRLGHGSVIDGYFAGLDVDHGHTGAQVVARRGTSGGEALIDDLIAPRIAGARGWSTLGGAEIGLSVAGDARAPDGSGDQQLVGAVVADGRIEAATDSGLSGQLEGDVVGVPGFGVGIHLGAGSSAELAGGDLHVGARASVRAGTTGYVPGWIGPLYERDRHEVGDGERVLPGQVAASRMGGLGGLSGAARLSATARDSPSFEVGYSQRPGLDDIVHGRVAMPHLDQVQLGAWSAAEIGGGELRAFALAAELRVRLPRYLFVSAEVARLYRQDEMSLQPLWSISTAIGAVLGE